MCSVHAAPRPTCAAPDSPQYCPQHTQSRMALSQRTKSHTQLSGPPRVAAASGLRQTRKLLYSRERGPRSAAAGRGAAPLAFAPETRRETRDGGAQRVGRRRCERECGGRGAQPSVSSYHASSRSDSGSPRRSVRGARGQSDVRGRTRGIRWCRRGAAVQACPAAHSCTPSARGASPPPRAAAPPP